MKLKLIILLVNLALYLLPSIISAFRSPEYFSGFIICILFLGVVNIGGLILLLLPTVLNGKKALIASVLFNFFSSVATIAVIIAQNTDPSSDEIVLWPLYSLGYAFVCGIALYLLEKNASKIKII